VDIIKERMNGTLMKLLKGRKQRLEGKNEISGSELIAQLNLPHLTENPLKSLHYFAVELRSQ
jgi:hypothetical protein